MVTKYGMGSSKLGQVSLDYEDDGRSISSETRAAIEEETRALVQAAYERAKALLKKHEAQLHVLATSLIDKETLSGDEIKVLLNMPLDLPSPATQTAAKKAYPA
jgi:ATP-dependent metalloprotease